MPIFIDTPIPIDMDTEDRRYGYQRGYQEGEYAGYIKGANRVLKQMGLEPLSENAAPPLSIQDRKAALIANQSQPAPMGGERIPVAGGRS